VRVTASQYGEVLLEKIYPGKTTSKEVLKETLTEVERILELDEEKRKGRGPSSGSMGALGL